MKRQCRVCGEYKPLDLYDYGDEPGRNNWCKSCHRLYHYLEKLNDNKETANNFLEFMRQHWDYVSSKPKPDIA